jgi:hypothetical protein
MMYSGQGHTFGLILGQLDILHFYMYSIPVKRILSTAHLEAFKQSPVHDELLAFVDALNESVVGRKLGEAVVTEVGWRGFKLMKADQATDGYTG